jgi:hypothetical protein
VLSVHLWHLRHENSGKKWSMYICYGWNLKGEIFTIVKALFLCSFFSDSSFTDFDALKLKTKKAVIPCKYWIRASFVQEMKSLYVILYGTHNLRYTIRNYKIDNISQLYTLKDTRMQNLNKVYRMVYDLWRFFWS